MAEKLHIQYDSDLLEQISAAFDLRKPNRDALRKLIFTLDGGYDPALMQVMNLATGVGKTYLMAAFIEYLRCQGIGNVVIVTPGKVVQAKTVKNFTPGTSKYIPGAEIPPEVVTPQDYSAWISRINSGRPGTGHGFGVLTFIFNIQQLIAPKSDEGRTHGGTDDAMRRKPRRFDENAGVLFEYLREQEDLVVIADESHLYSASAAAFHAALKELDPAASIGLTASILPGDHVIYKYRLYEAIRDRYVKAPVLAFRKGGYGADQASEEQQLRDALQLRRAKQAYYDAYARQARRPRLNAVLFVVCADVDHATQITELLRTPEYLGSELAVLQVDSRHDDERTQKLLERLDEPDSKILAVVSVNKLKEGWDVKNIAVVVTLRAMASEVLTQQTMGRGLRLPFGKYTDIWQIDQLDIISHQSFRELLSAENVLKQFGLEDASEERDRDLFRRALETAAGKGAEESVTEGSGEGQDSRKKLDGTGKYRAEPDGTELEDMRGCAEKKSGFRGAHSGLEGAAGEESPGTAPWFSPGTTPVESRSGAPTIGIRGFGRLEDTALPDPEVIHRNPRFSAVTYRFPVTKVELKQPPIDLSEISDNALRAAAEKVTSTGDVLYRKEIIAEVGKKLKVVDAESAEVDSLHLEEDQVETILIKLVAGMAMVPRTPMTIQYVKSYLVPKFMRLVTFDSWTAKSLSSACSQLQQLIKEYIAGVQRATKEVPAIYPTDMCFDDMYLKIGDRVHDPIDDRSEFVRGKFYSGWFKSLYEAESFDSFTGEYQLARLMNISPSIVWWHRLHPVDNAYVYYNARDRYFPDFVAYDKDGVHWIIEGKDKRGRDNEAVQAKRKAAESLVRRLLAYQDYLGQNWGYLIAYEDDIEKADSWDELKALAQPVSNKL